nr:MAG TPA: hypothetical protein [Caudoviricetes sp.]
MFSRVTGSSNGFISNYPIIFTVFPTIKSILKCIHINSPLLLYSL